MTAFEKIQIREATLTEIGNTAMWDAALRILSNDQSNGDCPVVAKVTDAKGNQICITRINGIPILVGTSLPQRLNATALAFQSRWQATPPDNQTVIPASV